MSKEKFKKGDLVRVKRLPECMRHFSFQEGSVVIVLGSYHSTFPSWKGKENKDEYTLGTRKGNGESWYSGEYLELVMESEYKPETGLYNHEHLCKVNHGSSPCCPTNS